MSELDRHLENQANERSEMHDEDDKPRPKGSKIKPALKDKKEKMAKKLKHKSLLEATRPDLAKMLGK